MSAQAAGETPPRRGLVDTGVAIKVAGRFATDPMEGSYLVQDLAGNFDELVAEAEPLVAAEAGFGPEGPARSRVMSRAEWAQSNVVSIVNLLSPLLDKVEARIPAGSAGGMARRAYGSALGAQLGGVLGFVSQRVLGQYEIDPSNAEEVWFVGPNIVITERRFGFVPRDFRLWVAVHELTHRAQFEGNPWLRSYFGGLVHDLLSSLELQPFSLLERAIRVVSQPSQNPGGEPTPIGIRLLDEDQRRIFDRLQALMSVVEGHGNFIMDAVAEAAIPTQPRMRRSLRGGSWEGPLGKVMRRLLGLELKKAQYEEGQNFFNEVSSAARREGVKSVFTSPETMPTLAEIRSPRLWLSRVSP